MGMAKWSDDDVRSHALRTMNRANRRAYARLLKKGLTETQALKKLGLISQDIR